MPTNFKACVICTDETSYHCSAPVLRRERVHSSCWISVRKAWQTNGLIKLRQNKKRNTDSKYVLHPFTCWAPCIHAASDGPWIDFPMGQCRLCMKGGFPFFFFFFHLNYCMIFLEENSSIHKRCSMRTSCCTFS